MTVRVEHTIDKLARDYTRIALTAKSDLAEVVRDNAREGSRIAQAFAKESAGAHGKHYWKSITPGRLSPLEWEYGPDPAEPQGGMSFEYGSRNQPPHLDLARSADIISPKFAREVVFLPPKWFRR